MGRQIRSKKAYKNFDKRKRKKGEKK